MNATTVMRRKPYLVVAAAMMLLLTGFTWALALRERSTRKLLLEYRVHKTITALTELIRVRSPTQDDLAGVRSFGLYAQDGSALFLYGGAPDRLERVPEPGTALEFSLGKSDVAMVRALGRDFPGRGGMGPMMNRMLRDPREAVAPAFASIRASIGDYWLIQYALLGVAGFATMSLALLYAALAKLYGRYERTRLAEEKNRELVELGQAARTIVHEIKNPLGVISIQCGILRRSLSPVQESASSSGGSAAVGHVRVIEDEVGRLAAMAERIRGFLKPPSGERRGVPARDFFSSFGDRYRGRLDTDLSGLDGADILVDGEGVREALDNLIVNAIEASAVAHAAELPRLEAQGGRKGLTVTVSDRGPGVPDESRLFEPFFTTKEKGTGLGLALARKHVQSAGGTVEYARRAGGGSVFTVRLPALAADTFPSSASADAQPR